MSVIWKKDFSMDPEGSHGSWAHKDVRQDLSLYYFVYLAKANIKLTTKNDRNK